jgi:hypothetical protein
MLQRLGRTPVPREQRRRAFAVHLERLHDWRRRQANRTVLRVSYHDLVQRPREPGERVRQLLGGTMEVQAMVRALDPSLYRSRKPADASVTGCPTS